MKDKYPKTNTFMSGETVDFKLNTSPLTGIIYIQVNSTHLNKDKAYNNPLNK